MAQTQLNRVYVQSIDGTGVTVNTLSIGTKALTSGITIGGAGTAANTITVDGGGIRINSSTTLDGTTTIPNLNATTAIVSGNTSLQNTSTLHLGVRGNASIVNASINALTVVGQTTLANTSITNLGVTSQITLQNTSINGTLNVAGLTTMVNVSTTSLSVINNVSIGGNVSIKGDLRCLKIDAGNTSVNGTLTVAGQTVLQNTSVNTTLNVDGTTTLRTLNVNAQATLNAGLGVTGAVTVNGNFTSSSLTINSGTVLNNVSLTTLTVSGNSSLNAVDIRGAVNINTGGTATTTIGSANSRTVIANVSTSDLTVTGTLWATAIGSTEVGYRTVIGNTSIIGGVDINTGASTTLTTIGSATSRTVIGNMSTSNTTVTGSLWITGATAINKSGLLLTEIGSTTAGSRTVIGNTSMLGGIDINTAGTALTTIGSVTSRTIIGNMSTSDTTVTGSLWITGATEINKSGITLTEIGSTTLGSRTVIGNTSMNGSVDINTTGIGITAIGSTAAGYQTIIGNTSMNGSIDINTTGTGITTMGSATSSTVVKGDMSVTKLLTTGYTPGLYNYAPTFFAAGFSGGNVSFSNGPDYGFIHSATSANVSSISPVSFLANKKYIVNFNARWEGAAATVTILGTPFTLTATNTLYRQVVTSNVTTSTLALSISGGATSKIIWSLLTIEPFYDMTLGSNQISLGGEINVSAGNPFTDWDPTRMLFTTSTITIGANPRIAIGKNSATNISTYVATSDSAVNASFFSSTDGVTWGQGNFTAVTNPRGIAYNDSGTANSGFYMVTGASPAKIWASTTGISGWTLKTTPSLTMNSVTGMIYGNSNLVIFNATTANNIMFSLDGTAWDTVPSQVPISITDMAYGRMTTFTTNGIYIFVACGTDTFYRFSTTSPNSLTASGWGAAAGTKPVGTWSFVSFGNDTFIAASNDATGKVSRSTDAGVNWQTPILLNEILTSEPIYLEDTWFIGSNTGLYVSKDNGLTWTKRVGNSLTRSVYGGKFVDVGTSLSLITKRNQRTDGSSISPDVITIGHEGATTVIGGTTTNIGGRASILQGLTLNPFGDTSNHLTFSRNGNFTVGIGPEANPKLIMGAATNTVSIPGALDVSGILTATGGLNVTGSTSFIGTPGTDLLKLQGTPASDTIEAPYIGNGTNLAANFTDGGTNGTTPTGPVDGVYTFSTGSGGSYGFVKTSFTVSKGFTYKTIFTARADTTNTNINISYGGSNANYFNNISQTEYKTYTGYFTAVNTGLIYISVSGTGNVARTIKYTFFSVEPLYGATLNHSMYVDGGMNVTETVTMKSPITIGYTIPTLNTQLGYYVRSTYSSGSPGINMTAYTSFCPIGPLVPGLYQANVMLSSYANYTWPYFNIDVIGRATPFAQATTITGENKVYTGDGLYFAGYKSPGYTATDIIVHNMSGLIWLGASDILSGSLVSYFCVRANCSANPTIINLFTFSVVRIG